MRAMQILCAPQCQGNLTLDSMNPDPVLRVVPIEHRRRNADLRGVHADESFAASRNANMTFAYRSLLASLAFTATVILIVIALPTSW